MPKPKQPLTLSTLAILILNEAWPEVTTRITTHPSEITTWNNGYLPLHRMARTNVPLPLLHTMISTSPDSLRSLSQPLKLLPLHCAVSLCCVTCSDVIEVLVTEYPEGCSMRDVNGNTPLMSYLCYSEDCEMKVVKLLLECDEECVMRRDDDGGLLLHWAARCASVEVVVYIARLNGMALRVEDEERRTPRVWAELLGRDDVRDVLIEEEERWDSMCESESKTCGTDSSHGVAIDVSHDESLVDPIDSPSNDTDVPSLQTKSYLQGVVSALTSSHESDPLKHQTSNPLSYFKNVVSALPLPSASLLFQSQPTTESNTIEELTSTDQTHDNGDMNDDTTDFNMDGTDGNSNPLDFSSFLPSTDQSTGVTTNVNTLNPINEPTMDSKNALPAASILFPSPDDIGSDMDLHRVPSTGSAISLNENNIHSDVESLFSTSDKKKDLGNEYIPSDHMEDSPFVSIDF